MRISLALLTLLAACADLDGLRDGEPDVSAAVLRAAADLPDDASLDAPLNAFLARRVQRSYTTVDDERVIAVIRTQTERRAASARPWIERLVFDPSAEVQMHALAALETLGDGQSLPIVGQAALESSRPRTREQAYHTFSVLAREPVAYLDAPRVRRILAERVPPPDAPAGGP